MSANFLANLGRYIPELLMVMTMVGLLFLEATYKLEEKGKTLIALSASFGLLATFVCLCLNLSLKAGPIFTNAVVIDAFSTFMKMIMVLGGLGAIHLSHDSKDIYQGFKSEYTILAIGVIIGGMLLASANNLLTLYLGVETLSILSYVLASMKKYNTRSSEAGLKYALYGGISAGIMCFGMAHMYGILGTIQFVGIAEKLGQLKTQEIMILLPAFLLFFVGIGFKIACFPFHMWTPDVYEGAPIPVTTFFAIVPKMAAMTALVRVSFVFFEQEGPLKTSWIGLLQVVAALTMTVGNVSALGQKSVKRMLAYSSIAHAGTMLLGVIVINDIGTKALLFYGLAYLFMTLVAFYITSYVSDQYGNDHFERFNGLFKRYPLISVLMAFTMFSLGGLPPFSGFVAKFNILAAVIDKKYYGLALVALINSVISLYYYMRIVRLMVLKSPESEEKITGLNFFNHLVIAGLSLPVLLLGIFWDQLMILANGAKIFIH